MPRVKVIWSRTISTEYDDFAVWTGPVSGWEDLSDDEVEILRQNLHFLQHPSSERSRGYYTAHIIIDTNVSPRTYLEQAVELRRLDDERRAKAEKVKVTIQKKRAKSAKERRKAQFERLQKEFES